MNLLDATSNDVYGLLAGVLTFCVAPLLDWVSMKRLRYIKPGIIALMIILISYALYAVSFSTQRFNLPGVAIGLGWFLLLVSVLLMTYSIFIEIPFVSARTGKERRNRLVTTGTYALTRHPGVLWYGLFLVSLLLVTGAKVLLIAAPIWFLMDVLWVVLQDRYFFVLMFKDYRQYQKETPMLIPTIISMERCLKTLSGR